MIKLKFLLEQDSVKLKSDTRSLQRWLNAQSNYKGEPLEVDGKFGPLTATAFLKFLTGSDDTGDYDTAVEALQDKINTDVDGKFGPKSRAALFKALGGKSTQTTATDVSPAKANFVKSKLDASIGDGPDANYRRKQIEKINNLFRSRKSLEQISTDITYKKYLNTYDLSDPADRSYIESYAEYIRGIDPNTTTTATDVSTDTKIDTPTGTDEEYHTIVIGGIKYATAKWMKTQWLAAGKDASKVLFINHNQRSKFKKLINEYNIKIIMGFSAGALLIWPQINNSKFTFIGLIDPSTPKKYKSLPGNVKMISRWDNWGCCPNYRNNLKAMEGDVSTRTELKHKQMPKHFFETYL